MKVRLSKNHKMVYSSNIFNTSNIMEVIVYSDEIGADSMFIVELDVEIGGVWMPLSQAFANNDLIVDNHNTMFFEPTNTEEKNRGYRL